MIWFFKKSNLKIKHWKLKFTTKVSKDKTGVLNIENIEELFNGVDSKKNSPTPDPILKKINSFFDRLFKETKVKMVLNNNKVQLLFDWKVQNSTNFKLAPIKLTKLPTLNKHLKLSGKDIEGLGYNNIRQIIKNNRIKKDKPKKEFTINLLDLKEIVDTLK